MLWRLLTMAAARVAVAPGRALLLAGGIAIGVAMALAIHLINKAAVSEFALSVRSAAGDADLQIIAGRAGFGEALYPEVARRPEVAVASPVIDVQAVLVDRAEPLRILGVDPLRALQIDPLVLGDTRGLALELLAPDSIVLSRPAARMLGLTEGSTVNLLVGRSEVALRVAGVFTGGSSRGALGITDIATAQWRLGLLGRLNRIDLRLRPGAELERVSGDLARSIPPGASVTTPQARADSSRRLSQAYRVNLNVLALVALFTGGFLVFSAQMLETVRRRTEHALLRVVGLTRRRLVWSIVAEAALVGAAGALLGVAAGYTIAHLALVYFGGDLGAGQFRGLAPELAFAPWASAGFIALGVGTAVAGSLVPALDAARVEPARALHAGESETALARVQAPVAGLALTALGVALAFGPPLAGIPLFGYLSVAALVFGAVGLMPALARWAFGRLTTPRHPVIGLASAQLRAAPGQASVSLAAMLASFSLMVAMAIMVSSFRASVDDWLERILPADLYFRVAAAGETAWLEPDDERAIAAVAGIRRAEFLRAERLLLDPERAPVVLLARAIDARSPERVLPLVERSEQPAPQGVPPVWVSEAVVDLYGFRPGATIELPLAGEVRRVHVVGVWRDYAREHGSIVMSRAAYTTLTGDTRSTDGSLWLEEGTTAAAVAERIRALPAGKRIELAEPGEIRALSLALFDRSFAVTYVLEGVAILVGLFGLATSLAAIVLARRREFGMLRHVGMTRREIAQMVSFEGLLVSVLGVAAGSAVGAGLSLVLIYVVNRQSFHWSMDVHVPWEFLAALATLTVAAATATAWAASRGATGRSVVQAVREDW